MTRRRDALFRLLRSAGAWALGASVATVLVSTFGRVFCLPPYWPRGMAFRCRPTGLGRAILHAPLDALLTTLFLFVPALPIGAAIHLLVAALLGSGRPGAARVAGALAGAGAWVWLARRLEPSHLDFILGGVAIGAGALVGAAVGGWYMTRR